MMHGPEKSDPVIVAGKPTNKAEQPPAARSAGEPNAAEPVERRAGTKGNAGQQSRCRTQRRASVSQDLERIRQTARARTKERRQSPRTDNPAYRLGRAFGGCSFRFLRSA